MALLGSSSCNKGCQANERCILFAVGGKRSAPLEASDHCGATMEPVSGIVERNDTSFLPSLLRRYKSEFDMTPGRGNAVNNVVFHAGTIRSSTASLVMARALVSSGCS